ncbi:MAG: serine hydrolase, partial [Bryobacteraceae bacterium]|nr:serine hydrolase [Bryobacteraceae bacterium]
MMPRRIVILLLTCVALQAQTSSYFPPRHTWSVTTAADAGFHEDKLKQAIDFIKTAESKTPKDLRRAHDLTFAREAYGEPLGPFTERGSETGIILRHGRIVAEWGNPNRVDMTFSVTKSLLSSVVGVALDRGLIRDLHEPVVGY